MKHLSVRTKNVNAGAVARFRCAYKVGDVFVTDVDEVDCPTCIKQIRKADRHG